MIIIQLQGLNGQLPNLDLVNLINRLCTREGLHSMFQVIQTPKVKLFQAFNY
ncbi:MAG TPA: hypothetical protein EYQ00_04415 [Dehalococcoidia bacterium]|nr:hypothetical protein [Dehalococcoidia bacterium]